MIDVTLVECDISPGSDEEPGQAQQGEDESELSDMFCVVVQQRDGSESSYQADAVIDATGTGGGLSFLSKLPVQWDPPAMLPGR